VKTVNAMKIASRPRSRTSKDNESTGRTTRSSSTPRSLRQSDLSIRRTQPIGLKRDIADLKRQTKVAKKRSPITARQTRAEVKGGTCLVPFMAENSTASVILGKDSNFPLSTSGTDLAEVHPGAFLIDNDVHKCVVKSEGNTENEGGNSSYSIVQLGIGDDNDGYESAIDQAVESIGPSIDGDVSGEEEHIELATRNGGGKVKRRRRRRRFVPKKKPKIVAQEVEKTNSSLRSVLPPKTNVPNSKEDSTSRWIAKELRTSRGFVDKVQVDFESDTLVPMRRKPRMASLNAIAKVNAVLHSYSPSTGKSAQEIGDKSSGKTQDYGIRPKVDRRRQRSTSSVTQTDDIVFFTSIKGEQNEWKMSGSGDVFQQQILDHQPISDSSVSSTSNWASEEEKMTTKDKAVQTVFNHKAVQTEIQLLDNAAFTNSPSGCTCGYLENVHSQEHMSPSQGTDDDADWMPTCTVYQIPPKITKNSLEVPLCSCISTKTTTHTIAIPFTKKHMLTHTDAKHFKADQKLSAHNSKRMASLNAIAMMNAMKVLDKPLFGYAPGGAAPPRRHDYEKSHKQNGGQIRIPKISFQATSTSKFSLGSKGKLGSSVKASQMKSLSNQIEHLIETKRQAFRPSNKMINGWVFEGDPSEQPYAQEDRIIIRRYYPSMRRNEEVINVRDAVLLKSGPRKKDLPFVARVSAIWEDDEGHLAGDMMISVFWYYRPEQTEVGKLSGYHGEYEVLASRHRDDNSAACVVDKCFVLSYPQYCRFRAKNRLYRESRKAPLSPVPPTESTRPGIVPPANTDPNLVFFCRHVYDSRTGRILKNPFY